MIIGIAGKMRAGKSTLARYMKSSFARRSFYFNIEPLAKPVKQIAHIICGLSPDAVVEKQDYCLYDKTYRQLYQEIGTDLFRNHFDPDVWIKCLMYKYRTYNRHMIVDDVRFVNECEQIKAEHGILIKVIRPVVDESSNHISEHALDGYNKFDYTVHNVYSLDGLKAQASFLVDVLHINGKKEKNTTY